MGVIVSPKKAKKNYREERVVRWDPIIVRLEESKLVR